MVTVNSVKWTTVKSDEVVASSYRLEASVFNIEARQAKDTLDKCRFPIIKLWSANGLIADAFYPTRFKRVYVNKTNGFPMILPSQMLSIAPKATKFISKKTAKDFDLLKVRKNTLLLTRSGTIGNCTVVSATLAGNIMSDDVIRVSFKHEYDLGFTYAYLQSKTGQLILATNNYGSVIQHIEPEHLQNVSIPNPPKEVKQRIHQKIKESFELRDESNRLMETAERLLLSELKLKEVEDLRPEQFDSAAPVNNFVVGSQTLDGRLDGSYHAPIVREIIRAIEASGATIVPLNDKQLSKAIFLPLRFKRVYVDESYGKVFFGGKQLYEINPTGKKYLSLTKHGSRISSELILRKNMILVTRSGTVGKVNLVPSHWEDWVANDHILRVTPQCSEVAGYIYVWLNSDFGRTLIQRFIYGSVVDEIEEAHLAEVEIPILEDALKMKQINDLALQANELRSKAYYLEQDAIKEINEKVIFNL